MMLLYVTKESGMTLNKCHPEAKQNFSFGNFSFHHKTNVPTNEKQRLSPNVIKLRKSLF